ncbi:MAG: hypothetical protein ACREB5_01750, partial [Sphingomonadaceae bacterium]
MKNRLFGGRHDMFRDADEQMVISGAVERDAPPAICLAGDFERVTSVQEETDWQVERDRLQPGRHVHGATVAYRIPDVIMAHGNLFSKNSYLSLRKYDGPNVLAGAIEEIDEAMLCTSFVAERYFGHWLRDGLLYEELAAQFGTAPLVCERKPWIHERGYRQALSLHARHIIRARIRKLWIVDDRGLNASWAARLGALRGRLRAAAPPAGPRYVYLRRGVTGSPR